MKWRRTGNVCGARKVAPVFFGVGLAELYYSTIAETVAEYVWSFRTCHSMVTSDKSTRVGTALGV
jgi:hypothetical protein